MTKLIKSQVRKFLKTLIVAVISLFAFAVLIILVGLVYSVRKIRQIDTSDFQEHEQNIILENPSKKKDVHDKPQLALKVKSSQPIKGKEENVSGVTESLKELRPISPDKSRVNYYQLVRLYDFMDKFLKENPDFDPCKSICSQAITKDNTNKIKRLEQLVDYFKNEKEIDLNDPDISNLYFLYKISASALPPSAMELSKKIMSNDSLLSDISLSPQLLRELYKFISYAQSPKYLPLMKLQFAEMNQYMKLRTDCISNVSPEIFIQQKCSDLLSESSSQ